MDYRDGMRLCREKIKGVKTQLELNLATAMKDNKNVSTCGKRNAKENLYFLLDAKGTHNGKG